MHDLSAFFEGMLSVCFALMSIIFVKGSSFVNMPSILDIPSLGFGPTRNTTVVLSTTVASYY